MAEYEHRETAYNNGLARVVGSYALGIVEADNAAKDAYIARIQALLDHPQPNVEFLASTSLIGLDQALVTRLSVPKLIFNPPEPIVIDETNISLDMTVSARSEDSLALNFGMEAEGEAQIGVGMFSAKVRVKASLSVAKESKRSSDYTSTTHVDLKMCQGQAPEGVSLLTNALTQSAAKGLDANMDLIEMQYLKLVQEASETDLEEAA